VQIHNQQGVPVRGALLRRAAERALRHLGAARAELSLALVDDAAIRALNRRYRRQDRATDVLAFPQDGAVARCLGGPPPLLGDVVISVETAVRRVGSAPRRLHAELGRYTFHGLLHLLGWDHHAPAERRRMRQQEQQVWRVAWDNGDSGGA